MSRMTKLLICLVIAAMPLAALTPNASFAKSTNQAKKSDVVYVTQRGKKYHKEGCRFIKNRETVEMSEEEAIETGLTPCGRCFKEKIQAKE